MMDNIKLYEMISGLMFVVLAFFSLPLEVNAASCTHYVSTSGNDSNSGTSISNPFRTIQKGVNIAGPDDVLCVRGGTYNQTVTIDNSGTSSNPFTVKAYPGEMPILDGKAGVDCLNCGLPSGSIVRTDPISGKGFVYGNMVTIKGDYVHFEGFKITRSMGRCLIVWNGGRQVQGAVVRDNTIHNCRNSGILLINKPNNTLIENNDISLTGSYATYSRGSGLDWGAALGAVFARNTIIRGNTVHENWGEGVIIGRDNIGTVFEDNVLYDNYAVQLYVHAAKDSIVRRNLIYHTRNPEFFRGGNPSACIVLTSSEPQFVTINLENIQIINNFAAGCSNNIAFWAGNGQIRNITVANNTLVNAYDPLGDPNGIRVQYSNKGNMSNVLIANNLVQQDIGDLIQEYGQSGVTYRSNLWSKPGASSKATSSGDVVGNPRLANPYATIIRGGVSANWYKLTFNSPAINRASLLSEVTEDYFGSNRGSSPDIGAHEYGGTPDPTSSPTPLPSPTNTPTPVPTSLPGLNLLINPSFEDDVKGWVRFSDGDMVFSVGSGGTDGNSSAKLTINQPGGNVQLYQKDIVLESDTKYSLSFDAKSNTGHDLSLHVHEHDEDFTNYGLRNKVFNVTPEWQSFSTEFTTTNFSSTVNDARLRFWFGPFDETGDVYNIDNVILKKSSSSIPGDIDVDGDVDIFDYNTLVSDFGQTNSPADFNGNGMVDIFDYNTLVSNFGTSV